MSNAAAKARELLDNFGAAGAAEAQTYATLAVAEAISELATAVDNFWDRCEKSQFVDAGRVRLDVVQENR
jgi:hypothetical protein